VIHKPNHRISRYKSWDVPSPHRLISRPDHLRARDKVLDHGIDDDRRLAQAVGSESGRLSEKDVGGSGESEDRYLEWCRDGTSTTYSGGCRDVGIWS
jgi:hypothetical protein